MENLNNIKDKLVSGLKDNIENFIYYGGNFGPHENYFNNIIEITNENEPELSLKCVCGHDIINNCYVKHKTTNEISVVGSCCINKFMTKDQKSRKCVFCNSNHKNNKNSICNDCRKIYCNFCNKLCNKKICDSCEVEHNYKKKCKGCNILFKHEKLDYCKECRIKCNYHFEYHIDNNQHTGYCFYCEKCYYIKCENCKNIIKFGKYKGTKFEEFKDNFYLLWCYKQYKEDVKKNNYLKEFVEYFIKKYNLR